MADVVFACCNVSELLSGNQADWDPNFIKPPDMETKLLIPALARRGVEATWGIWDDPDVDWESHRLCVIRSTWTHFLRPGAFLAWADRVSRSIALVNPTTLIEWSIDKSYLHDLDAHGVRIIPTEIVTRDNPRTIDDIVSQRGWTEIILKPVISAGATGIGRFHADDEGAESHLTHLLTTGDVVVQPFASDIQHGGETSLVFIDHEFSHAVRKHPHPGDYRAQPHLGATIVPCDPTDDELAVALPVLDALPARPLCARVDLINAEGAPAVVEVELIAPYLFLDRVPEGLDRLTDAIVACLDNPLTPTEPTSASRRSAR